MNEPNKPKTLEELTIKSLEKGMIGKKFYIDAENPLLRALPRERENPTYIEITGVFIGEYQKLSFNYKAFSQKDNSLLHEGDFPVQCGGFITYREYLQEQSQPKCTENDNSKVSCDGLVSCHIGNLFGDPQD